MDTVINVVHNADIYGFFHSKLYSVNIIEDVTVSNIAGGKIEQIFFMDVEVPSS